MSTPLIVNGDDFGMSEAVNRAIVRAHREGILTSASLMVNEPAAADAVRLARENPRLGVGLHLAVVLGRSALPRDEIPHLVNRDGFFRASSFAAGLVYRFNASARRELCRELRAQFERFAATGLPFSHVDGHAHMHLHPDVFAMAMELCEEYGVRQVRLVRDDFALNVKIDSRGFFGKMLSNVTFQLLSRHAAHRMRGRGYASPERTYGFLQTGNVTEEFLCRLVSGMKSVSSEIYAHPRDPDAAAEECRINPGGVRELQALLSDRVRRAIEERGFALTTYGGLAASAENPA